MEPLENMGHLQSLLHAAEAAVGVQHEVHLVAHSGAHLGQMIGELAHRHPRQTPGAADTHLEGSEAVRFVSLHLFNHLIWLGEPVVPYTATGVGTNPLGLEIAVAGQKAVDRRIGRFADDIP